MSFIRITFELFMLKLSDGKGFFFTSLTIPSLILPSLLTICLGSSIVIFLDDFVLSESNGFTVRQSVFYIKIFFILVYIIVNFLKKQHTIFYLLVICTLIVFWTVFETSLCKSTFGS